MEELGVSQLFARDVDHADAKGLELVGSSGVFLHRFCGGVVERAAIFNVYFSNLKVHVATAQAACSVYKVIHV